MEHYTDFVKSASAINEAKDIMSSIYQENPSHWPNGLSAEHFDGGLYLVRKSASQQPVGFVGWQERNDGMQKVGYYSVGILPKFRRVGFAKEAVTKLIAEKSATVDIVKALVEDSNKPSIGLARVLDGVTTEVTKSASNDEAVIIDKGVSEGAPVKKVTKDKNGVTVYYSKDRGEPEDAKVVSRAEAEKLKSASDTNLSQKLPKAIQTCNTHIHKGVHRVKSARINPLSSLMKFFRRTPHISGGGFDPSGLDRLVQAGNKVGAPQKFLGSTLGAGAAAGENELLLADADPAIRKINLVLGAITGGHVGGKLFKNKFLAPKDKTSFMGALGKAHWPAKQMALFGTSGLTNLAGAQTDYTNKITENVQTELEAAQLKRESEKIRLEGNPWKDIKDYAKENPWKTGIVGGGIGASVLGAYLYNALKKPNKPKPGVMTVEIPEGEVRDRFYTNLSRNMLFKDPKKKPSKKQLSLENNKEQAAIA